MAAVEDAGRKEVEKVGLVLNEDVSWTEHVGRWKEVELWYSYGGCVNAASR